MAKFLQGDLVVVNRAIEYGPAAKGRMRSIRAGTPGVLVKGLTGGQWWAYFHGHPLIVLGDTADIRRR
jgi:hypothetical protein